MRRAVVMLVVAAVIVLLSWMMLRAVIPSDEMHRVATILKVSDRGRVEVTIQGEGAAQRAESGLRLYDGDLVKTDAGANATLQFFDGTSVTLDSKSSLMLGDVLQGVESSTIELSVQSGQVFIESGTGTTVNRGLKSKLALSEIPAYTRAVIGRSGEMYEDSEHVVVFATTGPGVMSSVDTGKFMNQEIITGEGQELTLSSAGLAKIKEGADPYDLRSVLDDKVFSSSLYIYVSEWQDVVEVAEAPEEEQETTVDGELLVIDEPADGSLLDESAVLVKGRVGSRVTVVRVNGYSAELNEGVFEKEIALPDEEEFSVEVQAEDKDGLNVATKTLELRRDIKPPEPPIITSPARVTIEDMAEEREPVPVQADSFEIEGDPPEDAIGIIVNGYRLQKFKPGKPWSYLVDPELKNVRVGENTYEVIAVDHSGNQSEPVSIVILWKAQPVPEIPEGEDLPRDEGAALYPGSLRVIAPTSDGSQFVTNLSEVLIEGETHPETHSVSVNGFTLTLYEPGKVTWNYIAKEEYRNFKVGVNRYTVVARNREGMILDVVRYVVERR